MRFMAHTIIHLLDIWPNLNRRVINAIYMDKYDDEMRRIECDKLNNEENKLTILDQCKKSIT